MIDGGGSEDCEPNRQKARRFLQAQSAQSAIELDRFQEPKPTGGEGSQALETFSWLGSIQRRAQISAEITRDRQPAHHRRTGGGGLHRNDRIQWGWTKAYWRDAPCSPRHDRISGPAA